MIYSETRQSPFLDTVPRLSIMTMMTSALHSSQQHLLYEDDHTLAKLVLLIFCSISNFHQISCSIRFINSLHVCIAFQTDSESSGRRGWPSRLSFGSGSCKVWLGRRGLRGKVGCVFTSLINQLLYHLSNLFSVRHAASLSQSVRLSPLYKLSHICAWHSRPTVHRQRRS